MEINLSDEKYQNNKEIKNLMEMRNVIQDIGMLEGSNKRDDIKSIDKEIEKLKKSNQSSLK